MAKGWAEFSTQDHQKNPPNLGIKVGENCFLCSLIFFILSLCNKGTVNLLKLQIRLFRVYFHVVVFLKYYFFYLSKE